MCSFSVSFRKSVRLESCILFFRFALPNSSSSSLDTSFLSGLSSSLSELGFLFLPFNLSFLDKISRDFLLKMSPFCSLVEDFSFSLSFAGFVGLSGDVRGSSQQTLHLHFRGCGLSSPDTVRVFNGP